MLTEEITRISEIIEAISSAQFAYKGAVCSNAGISAAKERLKNLMFTHCDEIITVGRSYASLGKKLEETEEELRLLSDALAESDDECAKLKRELKALKAANDIADKVSKKKTARSEV